MAVREFSALFEHGKLIVSRPEWGGVSWKGNIHHLVPDKIS
jgi:hypothetical protein